jgi:hypothetical protein
VVGAEGHEESNQPFSIAEGEKKTVTVAPGPRIRAPEVVVPEDDEPGARPEARKNWGIVGWTLAGLGVASLAVTGVMAGLIVDRDNTVDDHCNADRECDDIAFEAADEGKTFSTVGTTTFILGLAAVAGGLAIAIPAMSEDTQVGVTAVPGGGVLTIAVVR